MAQQIEVVHEVEEHHAGAALPVPWCLREVAVLLSSGPQPTDGDDLPDLARLDRCAGSRDRRMMAPMMADQQTPVQTRDRVDESKRLRVVHGDRLLKMHGDTGLEALDRGVDVKRVRVG